MAQHRCVNISTNENGVVLLLSVLIATAVGVAVGISVIMGGLILSQGSQAHREANQAKSLANACADLALQQIRSNTSFTGTNTVAISGNNCSYTVTSGPGEARTATSSATINASTRRVTVQISNINPSIVITSWQEQ